jgi:tetratricopeptide (TPR) repeat protein
MLGAASSTATEGAVALTERRYLEAAELFGQAAGYVPNGHSIERGNYFLSQAVILFRQGDERGDNAALHSSIETCGNALAEYPRLLAPLEWAMTEIPIGAALSTLGERESGTMRLEEAVLTFRAALEEGTHERTLFSWAATPRWPSCAQSVRRRRRAPLRPNDLWSRGEVDRSLPGNVCGRR